MPSHDDIDDIVTVLICYKFLFVCLSRWVLSLWSCMITMWFP